MENTKWSDESLQMTCQVLCEEFANLGLDINKVTEQEYSKINEEMKKLIPVKPLDYINYAKDRIRMICQNK